MANQALTRRSQKHENTAKRHQMGVRILKKYATIVVRKSMGKTSPVEAAAGKVGGMGGPPSSD